jgi:hypothetical protein
VLLCALLVSVRNIHRYNSRFVRCVRCRLGRRRHTRTVAPCSLTLRTLPPSPLRHDAPSSSSTSLSAGAYGMFVSCNLASAVAAGEVVTGGRLILYKKERNGIDPFGAGWTSDAGPGAAKVNTALVRHVTR